MGLGGGQLGHQNASKTCTLSQKVGRKRVPLSRKSTSKPQGGSKTRTLRQKERQKRVPLTRKSASKRQKRVPLGKKCVKNAYPQPESPPPGPPKGGGVSAQNVIHDHAFSESEGFPNLERRI